MDWIIYQTESLRMKNLNFIKTIILTLLVIFTIDGYPQQPIIKGYLSLSEAYNFNLPLLDVSIPMPAKSGFIVPRLSGQNIALEMNENVDYYFPIDMLTNNNVFKFSLTSSDESYLLMQIIPYDRKFDEIYLLEKARNSQDFIERTASLKNAFGESVSYSIKKQNRKFNVHTFYHQNHLFTFSVPSSLTDKPEYERLIKDLKINNFYQERIRYENRVKSGYYTKKEPRPDIEPENKLRSIKAKNKQDTRLVFTGEGFSFVLPKDYIYDIQARKLTDNGNGTTEVYRSSFDMFDNILFGRYSGPQDIFIVRHRTKNGKGARDFSNMADGAKQVYKYHTDFDLIIDGVKAGATFCGQPDLGSVDIWFENEIGYFSFTLSNVSKENIGFYDNLLSSIRIETLEKRLKYDEKAPLSSILKLEDEKDIKLNSLEIGKTLSSDIGTFRCEFEKIGATLYLPGKVTQYTWGKDNVWGKEPLILNDTGQTPLAPTYQDIFTCTKMSQSGYSVDCTWYLTYGAKHTVKELLLRYIHAWNGISTGKPYKAAGIIKAEDGSEWGIYINGSEREALILGCNDNYLLHLNFSAGSPEKLQSMLALLHKFKMKKISPPMNE
ncbi:hypothetical protein D0T84_15330 [Dysgonomonas sp. 521]|uniref:hypothetical protein n=1 Tax=Dysgonomonas sp. 521 TaxID=2302932 RepID=UPI0013D1BA3C|nr:hypothetical protein [Dysgonomonas sp. 521]NDV96273.1 hypothetical protein [Dysgonomonas sp. 521]